MSDERLPPGQSRTRKFPVVGEREPKSEALDLERYRLEITGLVAHPFAISWQEYLALPHRERAIDIHCVTGWSRLGSVVRGVPLAELLDRAAVLPGARFVRFESSSERGHDTSLPLDVARADTWLVHAIDGAPLSVEHGFPLRTVTPSRYFYKSLKWLRRIELLAEDRLGFWERESSYHNVGDPWRANQRFTTGSIDPAELALLRDAASFAPWRSPKKVLVGVDLRGWRPRSRDLSRLRIKNSDLREADFAGCNLTRANFSLSDLRGANLAGADATGADLEGANLAGANLEGVNLTATQLSATKFFEVDGRGIHRDARVAGLVLTGANGLLEDQEEFLHSQGVSKF